MEILRIKEIIDSKGIKLKDLANMTGLSYTYMSEVARNTKFPRADSLISIANALDVDIRDLFVSTKQQEKGIKEKLEETRDSIEEILEELSDKS